MTIYIWCVVKLECSKIFRIFLHSPEQAGNMDEGSQSFGFDLPVYSLLNLVLDNYIQHPCVCFKSRFFSALGG